MKWIYILFFMISPGFGIIETLYQRSKNISQTSWTAALTSSGLTSGHLLDCASKCQKKQSESSQCNAFQYRDKLCHLGVVNFLEDPAPGQEPVTIMIQDDIMETLPMTCRGGDNCCGKESTHQCGLGQGDCDHDDQCQVWYPHG